LPAACRQHLCSIRKISKTFIPGPTDNCFCGERRFMKMNTLEKAYDALLNMEPEIILPESVRKRAETPILRMLELSK
jgi:quinolinate synthase